MKIAVYTCITNNYDDLPKIDFCESNIDYICFTDNVNFFSKKTDIIDWQLRRINFSGSGKECNRAIKILPHLFLNPKYTHTVYLDGNIDITGSLIDFVNKNSSAHIALYEHPLRENVSDEFVTCAISGHASIKKIKQEYCQLLRLGYQETGRLYECSILLRRHNNSDVIKFSNLWWNFYFNGIKRDQLYFGIAVQLAGVNVSNLGKSDPRYFNKYFCNRITHNTRLKLMQRLLGHVNRLAYKYFPEFAALGSIQQRVFPTRSGKIRF